MDNKYEFMAVFDPENTMVKEFEHWVILVRGEQATLGDCLFVVKRNIPTFSDMSHEESAELHVAIRWYEEKCRKLYGADKFNYVVAMMRDNFAHFHAFPRYSKQVSRHGIEWIDDRWPRVIQFTPSKCTTEINALIVEELKE